MYDSCNTSKMQFTVWNSVELAETRRFVGRANFSKTRSTELKIKNIWFAAKPTEVAAMAMCAGVCYAQPCRSHRATRRGCEEKHEKLFDVGVRFVFQGNRVRNGIDWGSNGRCTHNSKCSTHPHSNRITSLLRSHTIASIMNWWRHPMSLDCAWLCTQGWELLTVCVLAVYNTVLCL